MKILFIGNIASSSHNLKKGLKRYEDIERIDLMFKENPVLSGKPSSSFLEPEEYDIVHLSYPYLGWGFINKQFNYIKKAKVLICHWRGTDLRGTKFNNFIKNFFYKIAHFINKKYFFKKADYHFYSTIDLKWWLRSIPEHKKELLRTPVDCELFKPMDNINKCGILDFRGGGKAYKKHKVKHNDMPLYLNQFNYVISKPSQGLSEHLVSCVVKESLACGLKVEHHEEKNRQWVIKNASISVISQKVYNTYKSIIMSKK